MRLAFVGGGLIRGRWPATELARHGWYVPYCGERGIVPDRAQAEAIVLHWPLNMEKPDYLLSCQRAGVRVLVEEDDDMTDLPEGFAIQPTAKHLQADAVARALADGHLVSTRRLAEMSPKADGAVAVVPNFLPEWVAELPSPEPESDGAVRVGWAGTAMWHAHDLRWLAPAAERVWAGARCLHVGSRGAMLLAGVEAPIEEYPFQFDVVELYRVMARADIGIVPLKPDEALNVAKSWLKALEFMMLGKPVVATRLPEQEALIEHGRSGFLAETPAEFAEYVQQLVHDAELRREMGARAKERARLVSEMARWQWHVALSSLLAADTQGALDRSLEAPFHKANGSTAGGSAPNRKGY